MYHIIRYITRATVWHRFYFTQTCCILCLSVNYFSNMVWPQLLVFFRKLTNFSTCATCASTYVAELLHD